jgi:serine/threonine protein kinase
VVDFGAVQDQAAATFLGSTVVGTYGYMAPEQFRGKAVPQSDLYALGATMLYMLSGRPPADFPQVRKLPSTFETQYHAARAGVELVSSELVCSFSSGLSGFCRNNILRRAQDIVPHGEMTFTSCLDEMARLTAFQKLSPLYHYHSRELDRLWKAGGHWTDFLQQVSSFLYLVLKLQSHSSHRASPMVS